METAVRMRGITKSFGPVRALEGVDLDLRRGEVLALLGDNGAGKSTLVKILSGVHPADGGVLEIQGQPVDWRRHDVASARLRGVETVHQERSIGEKQPLWRNVFVGRHLKNSLGFIDARREREETKRLLSDVIGLKGAGMHPDARAATLSGGERQGLAIARALYFRAPILVLDEPTTALGAGEAEQVLSFVERLREEGHSCLLVSHDLHHLHRVADRFALLERGRVAEVLERSRTSLSALADRLLLGSRGGA